MIYYLKKYKLFVFILMFLVLVSAKSRYVSAEGGINANEARVLAVARGGFEYNGEVYNARQSYVNQLISKLSSEDVNLTSEQADDAITTIYSNIEEGIKEGYLVKAASSEDDLDKDEKDEITEVSPEQKKEGINSVEEIKQKEDNGNEAEPESTPYVNENDDGSITIEDDEGNVIISLDGVLRNTGYSISSSIYYFILIGVLLICVLICSVRVMLTKNRKY